MIDAIQTAIQTFILNLFGEWAFAEEMCVLLCSMIPIIELRGAIPMAALFDIPWWLAYILSVIGNMIPVPFILLFIKSFITWMTNSRVKFFNKVADFLNKRVEKRRGKIEKFSFWGVCLFVAVPLPVTGAWTGSLVAAMIDMKFWKALLSCLFGVMIAGVIVSIIVYGGVGFLSFLV